MGGRHSRPGRQNQHQQDVQQNLQQYPRPPVYQQSPAQGGPYHSHDVHYPAHPNFYPNQYFGPGRPPYVHHPYPPPAPQFAGGPRVPPAMYPPPSHMPVGQPEREVTQTATIRNAVNLKKTTLRLLPVNGDPSKLAVFFEFDGSQPSWTSSPRSPTEQVWGRSVTTFFMATEEPANGCKLSTEKQPPSPPVFYGPGLNNKFPTDPSAPVAILDMAGMDDITLATCGQADKDSKAWEKFPLVIRLEAVYDKAKNDGHKLTELVPGEPQKLWVQSQSTYAVILRDDEGKLVPKTVKQKIWVEGISYELQEIYGMEHSVAAVKDKQTVEDAEERLCVICLVNERDTTVLPCRHMCMCHDCAQELRRQTSKCPICRNHVESLLHIKMQKGANPSGSSGNPGPASAVPSAN